MEGRREKREIDRKKERSGERERERFVVLPLAREERESAC